MPPWQPTAAFWARRLSIACALGLLALIYFVTPLLMRDGPSREAHGSATINNQCSLVGATQGNTLGASTCLLIVQFIESGSEYTARLQSATPFPLVNDADQSYEAIVTFHQRSLLGSSLLRHLVITRIAALNGPALTTPGEQINTNAMTQLPPGIQQVIAGLLLLGALLTFFYPWPVWKVRVNAKVDRMRRVELRNRDNLPIRRHLATLHWQTNIPMQQEVRIPGRLARRLRPGDAVILTYEHLRHGAFKSLRVSLPRGRKGWLPPGVIQIGALTPWRWRWLWIALLWLEIPLSLLLLASVS